MDLRRLSLEALLDNKVFQLLGARLNEQRVPAPVCSEMCRAIADFLSQAHGQLAVPCLKVGVSVGVVRSGVDVWVSVIWPLTDDIDSDPGQRVSGSLHTLFQDLVPVHPYQPASSGSGAASVSGSNGAHRVTAILDLVSMDPLTAGSVEVVLQDIARRDGTELLDVLTCSTNVHARDSVPA